MKVAEVCRKHDISEPTFYAWKAKFGGTFTTDARGRLTLSPDPATLRASISFRAEFAGDARHRVASATVH